jgi:hypothetical protein
MNAEDVEQVLDLARSTAEELAEGVLSLTQVAYALSKLWSKEFDAEFGVAVRDRIVRLLRGGVARGDEPIARALLSVAPNRAAAIRAVHSALGPAGDPDNPFGTVDERAVWLTGIIGRRFASYDRNPDRLVLDELYVLIDALKIIGFDDAHQAMKRRLLDIVHPDGELDVLETGAQPTATIPAVPIDLRASVLGRIRGQDAAVEKIAERLNLTRARLDLRPERPNGVFLFAGPTGVGKTELALQIAIAEYGGSDRLIRLDMSEYADREFGIARLLGSAPGYVGYGDPEAWLTTRVSRNPGSVILLDEIEKAHPGVWNTFLQVFDAGRLTDGRGNTVSFSETVVIMTSNLGVRESTANPVGFGDQNRAGAGAARQLAVIKQTLAPELLNRLDEVILFDPLSLDSIAEIAESELAAAVSRIATSGWDVSYDPGVPRRLAETGYSPAYGARHLHRNIEREFLGLVARSGFRKLHISVGETGLVAEAR